MQIDLATIRTTTIRNTEEQDGAALLKCMLALQQYECSIEPNRALPEEVAECYLAELLAKCRDGRAEIFVAESEAQVVGFTCIVTKHDSEDTLERDRVFAYVSDLIVLEPYRKQGIGRRLHQQHLPIAIPLPSRRLGRRAPTPEASAWARTGHAVPSPPTSL
ncbi:MAG: GNAT family N-acetyltransferase, partial [Planctomycetaceae bacterium]